jgi:hypothetical protein
VGRIMTQCERILEYIEKNGSITDEEAKNMKIHRLASRIYDLRRRGHNIVSENIYGKNEYGKWHCARYKKAV